MHYRNNRGRLTVGHQRKDLISFSSFRLEGMADWHALGEVHYRKWTVFSEMIWNTLGERLNIRDYRVYGAPYGGPLALIKDKETSVLSTTEVSEGSKQVKEQLLIFTASGKKVSEVEWENNSRSAGVGWSDREQLVS